MRVDRLAALGLFTKIIELGSFSRAAEACGVSRVSATYAVQELEARLGTRLLERTTRSVRPTEDGKTYYERCVRVLADLEEAESSVREATSAPRGRLRVDMHGAHARYIVLPRIGEFHALYPDVELVLSSGDRLVDLVREGVDCVVRAGTPRDSTLAGRTLAEMPQIVCASPEYIARKGLPKTPEDLKNHDAIAFFNSSSTNTYPFEFVEGGRVLSIPAKGWMSVNDAESYFLGAVHGQGIIQVPRFHAVDALNSGELVEILARWPSPPITVSVLYPHRRQMARRIRVFVDWVSGVYSEFFSAKRARTPRRK